VSSACLQAKAAAPERRTEQGRHRAVLAALLEAGLDHGPRPAAQRRDRRWIPALTAAFLTGQLVC